MLDDSLHHPVPPRNFLQKAHVRCPEAHDFLCAVNRNLERADVPRSTASVR